MSGREGDLFHLSEVVVGVPVQHHLPDLDQRVVLLGPHLEFITERKIIKRFRYVTKHTPTKQNALNINTASEGNSRII